MGSQGPAGADGAVGSQGPAGADGAAGPQGPAGAGGAVGSQGPTGADGAVGSQGPAGADGAVGSQGPSGADGAVGPQGTTGATGVVGLQYVSSTSNTSLMVPESGAAVSCPVGKIALSGGFSIVGSDGHHIVTTSAPINGGGSWSVEVRDTNVDPVSVAVTVHAICATVAQ